ncbi:MAG: hypothetical protein Q4C72_02175, partial [Eubacteriales bacterium]|nr:hypothetical protein [Eubacteriales bacterium]
PEPPDEPEPPNTPEPPPPVPPDEPAADDEPTAPSRPSHGGGSGGHTHIWDDGEVTREAACETDGERTYHCTADAAHTKTEPIPALGHEFSASWQSDGAEHWRECVRGDARSENAAHVRSDGAWQSDEANHWQSCDVCGGEWETAAHVWGAWSERADVTGHLRLCDICGKEETALHSYTYTDNGDGATHTKTCILGGESAALPHDWSGGAACVCGAPAPAPDPVAAFEYSGSGTVFNVRWAPGPGVALDPSVPVRALITIPYDEITSPVVVTLSKGADGVWTTQSTAAVAVLTDGAAYTATFVRVYQGDPTVNADSIEEVNQSVDFIYRSAS